MNSKVFTIGHSTRPLDIFLDIMATYHIELLADVRTIPKSRHNPQYSADNLAASLKTRGIEYIHIAKLGGLRHASKDSVNMYWRNLSFRGYADHMQTREFEEGLAELTDKAAKHVTVIMCAEVVPWRCHRSLISDALVVRGLDVEDIISGTTVKPHKLTPGAKVDGTRITYPGNGTGR